MPENHLSKANSQALVCMLFAVVQITVVQLLAQNGFRQPSCRYYSEQHLSAYIQYSYMANPSSDQHFTSFVFLFLGAL